MVSWRVAVWRRIQRNGGLRLVVVAILAFILGRYDGAALSGASPREVLELRQTVALYAQEWRRGRDQTVLAQRDRLLTQAAMDRLQQQNKDLLDGMAALEQQLHLYQQVINPHAHDRGLSIERFVLHPTADRQRYVYHLLLTRAHREGTSDVGQIQVSVRGLQAGSPRRITLHIGDDRFSLQYFQSISGEWVLPPGFQPQLVTLRLDVSGRQREHVEQQFKWDPSPA